MRSPFDQALLIRPRWARGAVDRIQALAGDPHTDPDQLVERLKELFARIPRAQTYLETIFLRGLLAEFLLYRLARVGMAPSKAALALMRSESLSPTLDTTRPERASTHPKVAAALGLIADLCHRPDVRLNDVATMVHLSPWHLSRLLRLHSGAGFAAHVRQARLSRGAALLESSSLSVKEIAGAVGYKWARDFSRDFAKLFGLPPHKWRRLRS